MPIVRVGNLSARCTCSEGADGEEHECKAILALETKLLLKQNSVSAHQDWQRNQTKLNHKTIWQQHSSRFKQ